MIVSYPPTVGVYGKHLMVRAWFTKPGKRSLWSASPAHVILDLPFDGIDPDLRGPTGVAVWLDKHRTVDSHPYLESQEWVSYRTLRRRVLVDGYVLPKNKGR